MRRKVVMLCACRGKHEAAQVLLRMIGLVPTSYNANKQVVMLCACRSNHKASQTCFRMVGLVPISYRRSPDYEV